jgi:hypothetical protein
MGLEGILLGLARKDFRPTLYRRKLLATRGVILNALLFIPKRQSRTSDVRARRFCKESGICFSLAEITRLRTKILWVILGCLAAGNNLATAPNIVGDPWMFSGRQQPCHCPESQKSTTETESISQTARRMSCFSVPAVHRMCLVDLCNLWLRELLLLTVFLNRAVADFQERILKYTFVCS